jgi:hypothetical protein
MFISSFPLKSFVQKVFIFLRLPVDYALFHPYRAMQVRALDESADFIARNMPDALAFDTPKELLAHALSLAPASGLYAEFGVNSGGSINFIAKTVPAQTIHGFDSFEGLPENWGGNNMAAGYFNRGGAFPKVRSNVKLHKGWFNESLSPFLAGNADKAAFLHIDCDIYSSTVTILACFKDRIVPGTVIVFDEYFNYPNWKAHEHKAFEEFVALTGHRFEYLAYSFRQMSVRILAQQ